MTHNHESHVCLKPMFVEGVSVCRSLMTKLVHVCLQIHNNPVGITLFSLFMATYIFYFYVRIRYTLFGGYFGYSLFILIVEMAASTNMVCEFLLLKGCFCLSQKPYSRPYIVLPCNTCSHPCCSGP